MKKVIIIFLLIVLSVVAISTYGISMEKNYITTVKNMQIDPITKQSFEEITSILLDTEKANIKWEYNRNTVIASYNGNKIYYPFIRIGDILKCNYEDIIIITPKETYYLIDIYSQILEENLMKEFDF